MIAARSPAEALDMRPYRLHDFYVNGFRWWRAARPWETGNAGQ